jgi:hypothetical protein
MSLSDVSQVSDKNTDFEPLKLQTSPERENQGIIFCKRDLCLGLEPSEAIKFATLLLDHSMCCVERYSRSEDYLKDTRCIGDVCRTFHDSCELCMV